MALNGILNTALSGLFTNQASLRVVANNVANVNNPDYTRLRANQESVAFEQGGAGVRLAGVERVVDEFLLSASRTAIANSEEFTIQRQFHDRLQGVLGHPSSDSSLSSRLDQAYSSLASLSLAPTDSLRRQDTIAELNNFLAQIDNYSSQIQGLRGDSSQQIGEAVDEANSLLRQIHDLNPLVVRAEASIGGEGAGALQAQMDAAINRLSEIIDVQVDRQSTGAVVVRTGSGQPLVDGSLAQLSYESPGTASAETVFPPIELTRVDPDTGEEISSSVDMSRHIRSGRLQGLLDMRDGQLVDAANSLGELAAHVKDEFNRVHNQFSAVPAPNELVGEPTIMAGTHAHGFTGTTTFARVDANNQVIAESTIDFSSFTTLNDVIAQVNTDLGAGTMAFANGVLTFSGGTGEGVVVADDPNDPSDRGGRGFSHFFGLNNLIESDRDGMFQTGVAAGDTHGLTPGTSFTIKITGENNRELSQVTVTTTGTTFQDMLDELNDPAGAGAHFTFALDGDGKLTYTPNNGQDLGLQIVLDDTDVNGSGVSFSDAFGLGDTLLAGAAQDIQVKDKYVSNPDLLSLSQYNLSAGVGQVGLSAGDQRGAVAFQELQTRQVSFSEAGGIGASNVSITQYTARWLGNQGLLARRATNLEEDNQALRQELDSRKADVSGVNMDEELSNLVVYQNAYNASARVLSSVQELYDTLLAAV